MAEVLAVMAAPAAEDRPLVGRRLQISLGQYAGDGRTILILELARVGGDAFRDQPLEQIVDLEQLRDKSPAPVEALSHAPRAFLGPVTQPDGPVSRQLAVI